MTWIPSYAQTGKSIQDTVRCYGLTELQYIAATLVEARACDTLLSNCDLQLLNRDSLITEKDYEITQLVEQLNVKGQIIDLKDAEIMKLSADLEKSERAKKWLKLGWTATTGAMTGLLIYFALG